MTMSLEGNAWKFGDDIDTDLIIPARYLNTSDPADLDELGGRHRFLGDRTGL